MDMRPEKLKPLEEDTSRCRRKHGLDGDTNYTGNDFNKLTNRIALSQGASAQQGELSPK